MSLYSSPSKFLLVSSRNAFKGLFEGGGTNMNMDLGEIEEYTPSSNIKMPNFPM